MTEQKTLDIVERCITAELFCDKCEFGDGPQDDCIKLREKAIAIVKEAFAQRDALLADLNTVCGGKFVDVCRVCGHYTPQHPNEKCELKGMACHWEWRGTQR